LLLNLLEKVIKNGTLRLYDAAGGSTFSPANSRDRSPPSAFTSPASKPRFFLNPELRAGEAYMDGTLTGRGRLDHP
jgi:cyclopropane-fatty-acyl-phospholipid synthase